MSVKHSMSDYWQASRHPLYGVLSVLPIILFYELIALTLNQSSQIGIRNAADVFLKNIVFRQILALVGIHGIFAWGLVITLILGFLFWKKYQSQHLEFHTVYFVIMFIESLVYAVLLGPVIGYMLNFMQNYIALAASIYDFSFAYKVMLSLGAGFYEELVFRVIILSGSVLTLTHALNLKKTTAFFIAAIFSSLLFSGFHYIGPFGEPFQFYSFAFRFFAGIIFALLYIGRGFGIAVYTHTLYDLLIILHQ